MPAFDLKALLDKMKTGPVPVTQPQVNPNITTRPTQVPSRVAYGTNGLTGIESPPASLSASPNITPPTPQPDYQGIAPSLSVPKRVDVRLGSDPNLTGLERKVADLETQRQAAQDFPSSKVVNGEVLPPKMHHGLKDELASVGKGIVINMGRVAQSDPNASAAKLLAGGATGGVVGGLSPISIDRDTANAALQRNTADLGQQLEIAKGQAEIKKLGQGPQDRTSQARHKIVVPDDSLKDEGINAGDEVWADVNGQPLIANGRHVLAGRAKTPQIKPPTAPHLASRVTGNGEYGLPEGTKIRQKYNPDTKNFEDDIVNGKPVIEAISSSEKPDVVGVRQEAERKRKYDAANREFASLVEGEKAAAVEKDKAYKVYGNLQAQYSRQTDADARAALKPQLDAAKEAAEKAQSVYAGFGPRKTAAQKTIDENAPQAALSQPSPQTHVLNKKAWLKSHPESDWPKAVAAAKAGGYQIVE